MEGDHQPTFSLAESSYADEVELEDRVHDEHVRSVEELPLELEGEREELDEYGGSTSARQKSKPIWPASLSPRASKDHSRTSSRHLEFEEEREELDEYDGNTSPRHKSKLWPASLSPRASKDPSRASSRHASRAPSRSTSRAPSRSASRAPSRRGSRAELYDIVEGEEYATEEAHTPGGEEGEKGEEGGTPTGEQLVRVKSHASTIAEFLNDPVEREHWRKRIHKTLEDPLYSRLVCQKVLY